MRHRLPIAALIVAMAVTASACGGSHSGSKTGTAASSGRTAASGSLDPKGTSAYIDAQARALCLVQSTAYPTQAALRAAYERAERSANLSADEFARARAAVAHDSVLRRRISKRVAATCGSS